MGYTHVERASLIDIRDAFFDEQLKKMGLTESQITAQNLSELRESLSRINEAITHPEGFREVAIKYASIANPVIAVSSLDELCKIHILPLLLERKKLILEKMNELSSEEKIENLQELIKRVSNKEIQGKLTEELNALQQESVKYSQEIKGLSAREKDSELTRQKLELLERKSKIWLSFLQRESAASLIGAVVLLLLTLALIFGKESQILSNGFLVILGYFFGQSSSRTRQDNNTPTSTNNNSLANM